MWAVDGERCDLCVVDSGLQDTFALPWNTRCCQQQPPQVGFKLGPSERASELGGCLQRPGGAHLLGPLAFRDRAVTVTIEAALGNRTKAGP